MSTIDGPGTTIEMELDLKSQIYTLNQYITRKLMSLPLIKTFPSGIHNNWHIEFRKVDSPLIRPLTGIIVTCNPVSGYAGGCDTVKLSSNVIPVNKFMKLIMHSFIMNVFHGFDGHINQFPPQIPYLLTVSDIRVMHYLQQTLHPIIPNMKICYRRNDARIDEVFANFLQKMEKLIKSNYDTQSLLQHPDNISLITKKSGKTDRKKEFANIPQRIICCNVCKIASNEMKWCKRCRIVRYCSKKCQKLDWNKQNHRTLCARIISEKVRVQN
eukprot:225563_1